MTAFPKSIDYTGWALVTLAALVALVAVVGIVAVLYASSPSAVKQAEQELHDAYYVIRPSQSGVIPFAVCLVLACLIAYIGYSQTKQFVERKISLIEPDGPANGSQPIRSE